MFTRVPSVLIIISLLTFWYLEKPENKGFVVGSVAYVFYAEGMKVTSGETSKAKLQESYDTGYAQAEEELPAIKRFLGL